MEDHPLFGGKLHVYKRENSSRWQCSTYFKGRNWRASTKLGELPQAIEFAENWFLELRAADRRGTLKSPHLFRDAAADFYREYQTLTEGERSPRYVKSHANAIRLYLNPFFGDMPVDRINAETLQEFRMWRYEQAMTKHGKPPARQTRKHDFNTLRQILKLALRRRWIEFPPDFSEPYRANAKVSHRAWLSPQDYARLCKATWAYAENPPTGTSKALCQQMHDYVVFMANTGLRPDEAARLEFRDVSFDDEAPTEVILLIDVRGKCGVGYCKSMPGAVRPFKRLLERNRLIKGERAAPTDKLFPLNHRELFNRVLVELDLKTDREGQRRTAYSLRHTYICLRLLNGANIYQLAKNCRTSIEMIEKYYASHISTSLDASKINVGKSLPEGE